MLGDNKPEQRIPAVVTGYSEETVGLLRKNANANAMLTFVRLLSKFAENRTDRISGSGKVATRLFPVGVLP